jgi:hypothetical protein
MRLRPREGKVSDSPLPHAVDFIVYVRCWVLVLGSLRAPVVGSATRTVTTRRFCSQALQRELNCIPDSVLTLESRQVRNREWCFHSPQPPSEVSKHLRSQGRMLVFIASPFTTWPHNARRSGRGAASCSPGARCARPGARAGAVCDGRGVGNGRANAYGSYRQTHAVPESGAKPSSR